MIDVPTSDSAAKQILLHLDLAREGTSKFILKDSGSRRRLSQNRSSPSCIAYSQVRRYVVCGVGVVLMVMVIVDDTHVLVKTGYLEEIKDLLQEEVRLITLSFPSGVQLHGTYVDGKIVGEEHLCTGSEYVG